MLVLRERFSALLTNKGPFPLVEFRVHDQVSLRGKRLSTFTANKRPLSAVHFHVRQQVMLQREVLFADDAVERSAAGMQQEVRVQAVLVREALSTVATDMRLYPCVCPGMCRQVMLQEEGFPTLPARIGTYLDVGLRLLDGVGLSLGAVLQTEACRHEYGVVEHLRIEFDVVFC